MSDSQKLPHPEVLWAQRKNEIYITINLIDVKDPEINLTKNKISFKGSGGTDKGIYGFEIDLFKEINTENPKRSVSPRQIILVLDKAEHDQSYWPRLQKDKAKPPFLKTDFNKWKDEDDDEDDENPLDGMDYSNFAGSGYDSDDEPTPDLEDVNDDSGVSPNVTSDITDKQEEKNLTEEEKEANSVKEAE